VHPEVIALVALEGEDSAVEALESRLRSLEPRLQELERVREVAATALDRAKATLASEQEKLRESKARAASSRTLQERNQKQLDGITNVREATAASAQLDQSRKIASDADSEAARITARVEEAKARVTQAEQALAEIEASQETERSAVAGERHTIEADLRHARMKREGSAKRVSQPLLGRYEKVRRRRRGQSVFPLVNGACGSCDTTLPVQRRHEMARTGAIEMCEACGVMIYAPDPEPVAPKLVEEEPVAEKPAKKAKASAKKATPAASAASKI
jgi:predicted  nucleic acid-binding Zn-ribbon protein